MESGERIAPVDCGMRVLAALDKKFLSCDHDFVKFSLVTIIVLDSSFIFQLHLTHPFLFCHGKMSVEIKDDILELYSPMCHAIEPSKVRSAPLPSLPPSFHPYQPIACAFSFYCAVSISNYSLL